MKSTLNGKRWCHVSCVLWIPETSFGDLYKMEPVVQLKSIPDSRWALVCTFCREKLGACIQCSYKTCAISYHVTCGFNANLDITTSQHPTSGDLVFKSFCLKHTAERRKKLSNHVTSSVTSDQRTNHQRLSAFTKSKKRISESVDEKSADSNAPKDEFSLIQYKISKAMCKFHTLITPAELSRKLNVKPFQAEALYEYWKLKRISGALFHNRINLSSNCNSTSAEPSCWDQTTLGLVDLSLSAEQQEQLDVVESLKNRATMFVALRQDLEKVRNMVTLIQKREKNLKTYHRVVYEMFKRQLVLAGFNLLPNIMCPTTDLSKVVRKKTESVSSPDEGICSGDFSENEGLLHFFHCNHFILICGYLCCFRGLNL